MTSVYLKKISICILFLKWILTKSMSKQLQELAKKKKNTGNLAIDCYSLKFHNGRRFLFEFHIATTCYHWIKIWRDNEKNYLYHFKTYFQTLNLFTIPLTKFIQGYLKKKKKVSRLSPLTDGFILFLFYV